MAKARFLKDLEQHFRFDFEVFAYMHDRRRNRLEINNELYSLSKSHSLSTLTLSSVKVKTGNFCCATFFLSLSRKTVGILAFV